MNRIKRSCTLLLAFVLTIALMLGVTPRFSIGHVFAENNAAPLAQISVAPGEVTTAIGADGYICFDLAADNVTIGATTYSGKVFVNGVATDVKGTHAAENKYYIYQSNNDIKGQTGYTSADGITNRTGCRIPQYPRVQNGTQSWGDYITDNTKVKEVSIAWDTAAANSGRIATGNNITFASESEYTADVTIDNIWSSFHEGVDWRTAGGIGANLSNTGINCEDTHIWLKLKGDNRVGCIHYTADVGKGNTIEFYDDENTDTSGSITVADFSPEQGGSWNDNHWASAIGGADSPPKSADRSDGIVIHSGVIYAGTTPEDNCTAIGGGGNDYGGVTINGGTVTAVAATTGTAIGGGIGWGGYGGDANVTINKGTVYAYNFGVDNSSSDKFEHYVPAVAIGGGSSQDSGGNANTTVNIHGGFVYAQSMGGAAIGGGGSAKKYGGSATINISGGTVIAKSVSGTFKGTADPDVVNIPAGVSIGGGTGLSFGGTVEMHISGGTLRTGSIGGGKSTGGGLTGSAQVYISDGDIVGQVIMAAGARDICIFDMSGGTLHDTNVIDGNTIEGDPRPEVPITYSEDNGGAVWMDAHNGKTTITGGTIENCTAQNGGAIYMTVGTFSISGTGKIINNTAKQDGGAVYVGGGTVTMSDGAINKNTAALNGGGVYVGGGTVTMSGGEILNNTATLNGGGMYVVGNAGQEGATVTMSGGEILNNTATQDGGGMYIDQGKVDIFGGSIHDNKATGDGGGVYVAGDVHMTGGSVKSNKATNGGGFCVEDGAILMYGGSIDHNTAVERGGGMHVSATENPALVDIFSGSISYNQSKNGGGVSVVSDSNKQISVTVGVNCEHTGLDFHTREFTEFDYPTKEQPADCGTAHDGHTHYHVDEVGKHSTCPQVVNNNADEKGGGFYLQSEQTYLTFYCVTEQGNKAKGSNQCWNMDVKGGHVNIGDREYHTGTADKTNGNILMQSSIFVEKGQVDVWGEMQNPRFTGDVSVQIEDPDKDHYIDHREVKTEGNAYKVHYYENFTENNVTSGLYVARQYPDLDHEGNSDNTKYDFTIMPSIFSRPGYKIVGWYPNPEGTGEEKYNVNQTYNLLTLDEAGKVGAPVKNEHGGYDTDNTLFILYAKWEHSGYVLKFDPNVGVGDTYTGTMENQSVTVGQLDGTHKIAKNRFKRPGYKFLGWALVPVKGASDALYADNQPITVDFTIEDGAMITLYAQWGVCNHLDYLTYKANGTVLTESCSECNGHTATATLSAVNCDYDGNTHSATCSYTANWLGAKPDVLYELAANDEWDAKDDIKTNWTNTSLPLHAGAYTASITVDGEADESGVVIKESAQIEYVISPVQWETPAVPKVSFRVHKVGDVYYSIITIDTPTADNLRYKITCLSTDGAETAVAAYPDWRAETEFFDISLGNYYYFYAKAIADRDHIESASSKSSAYLATGGNIVYIDSGVGIKVVPQYGDNSFQYTVGADDGYHLRGYDDNLTEADGIDPNFVKPVDGAESADAHIHFSGITISKVENADGTYTYTLQIDGTKVAYYQITLQFSGAVKNGSASKKVTDGQVFGDFNTKTTNISRDSAFTAQFTFSNYIPEEYTSLKLTFSPALPAKTTVIMKVDNGYWYYNLSAGVSALELTSFIAMGGTNTFSFVTTGTGYKTSAFQFIVDFSHVEGNTLTDSLTVSLEMTANPSFKAPTITSEISLGIQSEAVFGLTLNSVDGEVATLTCDYTASSGDASVWSGRKTAVVLTAPSSVPADLTLTAEVGGNITRYAMDANNQIIIPLGEVGEKSVKITLNSCLLGMSEENLLFTADWYVSQSAADISPLNGDKVKSCNVEFAAERDPVPSVRIAGTVHLCHAGGQLNVTVYYSGIPSGANVIAYLQGVKDGVYIDTGYTPVPIESSGAEQSFNMGQMDNGSYRILVIVQSSGANILQVPYYFVIT